MIRLFNKKETYLDHASSTPLDPRVERATRRASSLYANPGSLHRFGVEAKKEIRAAREQIADILHVRPEEIVFTSGGTESDNLAVLGAVKASGLDRPHVVTTNIEHSAVRNACKLLEAEGADVTYVPVEASGIVSAKKIRAAIQKNTVLVTAMYANNEIGTIQPIRDIAKAVRHARKENGTPYPYFHTDAAQAVNYCDLRAEKLGADLLSWNGSKIYGPKGIGGLYVKKGTKVSPLMRGGGQEQGFRPGTENLPGILGLAEAMKIAEQMKEGESRRLSALRDYCFARLEEDFPDIIINGDREARLPNNISISVPGLPSELLALELDAKGVFVSTKSACKSDDPDESYVIAALRDADGEEGSLRVSLGRSTSKKDIDRFLKALSFILKKLKPWYNTPVG